MSETNRPPLWKVVDEAWWSLVNTEEPHISPPASDQAACVIRALRDWLAPEEPDPAEIEFWPDAEAERDWQHNQRLRALLTAEADRAERGDV